MVTKRKLCMASGGVLPKTSADAPKDKKPAGWKDGLAAALRAIKGEDEGRKTEGSPAPTIENARNAIVDRKAANRSVLNYARGGVLPVIGIGSGTSDSISAVVDGQKVGLSNGEGFATLPAKTMKTPGAIEAVEAIIQETNDGKPPVPTKAGGRAQGGVSAPHEKPDVLDYAKKRTAMGRRAVGGMSPEAAEYFKVSPEAPKAAAPQSTAPQGANPSRFAGVKKYLAPLAKGAAALGVAANAYNSGRDGGAIQLEPSDQQMQDYVSQGPLARIGSAAKHALTAGVLNVGDAAAGTIDTAASLPNMILPAGAKIPSVQKHYRDLTQKTFSPAGVAAEYGTASIRNDHAATAQPVQQAPVTPADEGGVIGAPVDTAIPQAPVTPAPAAPRTQRFEAGSEEATRVREMIADRGFVPKRGKGFITSSSGGATALNTPAAEVAAPETVTLDALVQERARRALAGDVAGAHALNGSIASMQAANTAGVLVEKGRGEVADSAAARIAREGLGAAYDSGDQEAVNKATLKAIAAGVLSPPRNNSPYEIKTDPLGNQTRLNSSTGMSETLDRATNTWKPIGSAAEVPEFASESDARSAQKAGKIKVGQKVMIGGRVYTVTPD